MASLPARVWRAFVSAIADTPDPSKVGSGKWNADLNVFLGTVCDALSRLDLTADQVAYFTGGSSAALTSLTAYGRLLIAAADSPSARTLLSAVNRAGDSMGGNLDFAGFHRVTGLAAPSASTDAATKAYVDALAAVVSGALVFKGAWDASAGTFPGAGVAQTGWFYKVSVAGTVGGVFFSVGDDVYAIANNASTTTYANNWLKIEGTLTLAEIQAAVGFNFGTLAALSSVTASLISDASANGRSLIQAANYAAMNLLLGLEGGTGIGDVAAPSLSAADKLSYTTAALTAPRVWFLPAASAVQKGREIIVADMAGGVSPANSLTVQRAGAGADTINGSPTVVLDVAFGWVRLISDGVSKWNARTIVPHGTAAGNAVRLDSAARLPAVDGSQLTNIPGILYSAAQSLTVAQQFQAQANIAATGLSASRKLVAVNNGGAPTTKLDISADKLLLRSPTDGTCLYNGATGTQTCDTGAAGPVANGRDQAGAFAASQFLHFYIIWSRTFSLATLVSASDPSVGPTLPAQYTHWAYVGAWYFNGSSQLVTGRIRGTWFFYDLAQGALSGGVATAVTSVDVSSLVPPNALCTAIAGNVSNTNTATANQLVIASISGGRALNPIAPIAEAAGVSTTWTVIGGILPNVAQTIYYNLTATGGTAFFNVSGYEIPNGAN